jgi:hypothetical protein
MAKNPQLSKILRDYNYLYESLIDVKEISEIAEVQFREAMINSGDQEALNALVPTEQDSQRIQEAKVVEEEAVNHNDAEFKKLFRKVVIKCHPDKLSMLSEHEAEIMKEAYNTAVKANDKYDWGLLLRVANGLSIDCDFVSVEQIEIIKRRNEELKEEIERYEGSMAYRWYAQTEEEARNNFLAFCLGVFKDSVKNRL